MPANAGILCPPVRMRIFICSAVWPIGHVRQIWPSQSTVTFDLVTEFTSFVVKQDGATTRRRVGGCIDMLRLSNRTSPRTVYRSSASNPKHRRGVVHGIGPLRPLGMLLSPLMYCDSMVSRIWIMKMTHATVGLAQSTLSRTFDAIRDQIV